VSTSPRSFISKEKDSLFRVNLTEKRVGAETKGGKQWEKNPESQGGACRHKAEFQKLTSSEG